MVSNFRTPFKMQVPRDPIGSSHLASFYIFTYEIRYFIQNYKSLNANQTCRWIRDSELNIPDNLERI